MRVFYFCSLLCITSSVLLADDLQSIAVPKQLQEGKTTAPPLPPLPAQGSERIIASKLKGLVLVGDPSLVEKEGTMPMSGVVIKGLDIPGGADKLIERLCFSFLNQPLTQRAINQIKRQIVLYYREQNHPVVMVLVPEQKMRYEILQLVVIESRVGKVGVSGNQYVPSYRIRDKVRLQPGSRINEKALLQDVSWINSDPFRRVTVLFSPGERNGTTDVNLRVSDRKPWRVYGGADNTGSKFTGEARWFAGLNLENIFFPENLLSYQYTTASESHKFRSYTVQYIAPFPWRHTLSIFGGYALVRPDLSSFAKSTGKSYQASGRYEVPMWATYPKHPAKMTVGFDFKGTNNNLIFGEDNIGSVQHTIVNITQLVFGLHQSIERPGKEKTAIGFDLFFSPGELIAHQTKADFESLNPGAIPRYLYGRFLYSYEVNFSRYFSMFSQIRFQFSSASLISSEQFGLGGYSTVRGYRERVVNGDNAGCINVEARTAPFSFFSRRSLRDSLSFLAFVDFAGAWDHKKISGFPLKQTLLGVGPGLRYSIGSYLNVRLDIGFPLHNVQGVSEHPRLHFSAVLSY